MDGARLWKEGRFDDPIRRLLGAPMKITQITQTDIPLNNQCQIQGVKIGEKEYEVTLSQVEFRPGQYCFTLTFGDEEFHIQISSENKIRLSRQVHRPNHDHDDMEYLQVKEGDQDKVFWGSWPYAGRGSELLDIDFGPETVGY